jgi:RNA polymerase sigma-70 factor, ECF subfamily
MAGSVTRKARAISVVVKPPTSRSVSATRLSAAIAAAHAQDRPWSEVVLLYDRLAALDSSPVVQLNRAVAVALAGDVARGLVLLDAVDGLDGYHFFHAARADLLRRLDRRGEAANAYRQALELTANEPEARYLERRLVEVS